jgi:lipid-A-disaccharide synthase
MKYFFIAGEPSGDLLGAKLINALKAKDPEAEFWGIGGDQMIEAGLNSLLPMHELTVMGVWEAAMRLPQLLKIRNGIVEEIEKLDPDALITVDFPDFNFSVAKQLKKRKKVKTRAIHYVAPTVWAWRPGRAKAVANYLDAMICLFPFEPPYFKKHKLRSVYVGHPITDGEITKGSRERFRKSHQIADDVNLLGLYFGSRQEELNNHGKVIKETAMYVAEQVDNLHLVVPTLDRLEFDVVQLLQDIGIPAYIDSDFSKKADALAATDVGIAVSGTVALQLAYTGRPHVIVYKTHPITYWIVRLLTKVKHIHLGNIMLNKEVIPEFIQGRCHSESISEEVVKLFKDAEVIQKQERGFDEIRRKMGVQQAEKPSDKAARYIVNLLEASKRPKKTRAPSEEKGEEPAKAASKE